MYSINFKKYIHSHRWKFTNWRHDLQV